MQIYQAQRMISLQAAVARDGGRGWLNLWQHQLQLLTKSHVGVPLYKVTLCALCTSCDTICCPTAMPANFGTFHISSVYVCACVYMKLSVTVLCFPRIIFGWSKREKNKVDNEIQSALFICRCRSIGIELKLICTCIYTPYALCVCMCVEQHTSWPQSVKVL